MESKLRQIILLVLALCCSVGTCCARPRVGLVLGGGGAKGAAHVGVLKVLEREGIAVDCIAGTSIGSIVGGLYATGYRATELDTLFREQTWLSLLTDRHEELATVPYRVVDGVTYIFGFPVFGNGDISANGIGILRGQQIETMLDSLLGYRGYNEFETMKIPFRCVAANFRQASEVVLSSGSPALAMRASMAIPGVFKPVRWGEATLVDGGMMNNLPVDVALDMGADVTIVVDLQQNTPKRASATDVGVLGTFADMLGLGGLLNWVTTRPDIEKYYANRQKATIYIHPDIPDFDATSFDSAKIAEMIDAGERAAVSQLSALRGLLQP